jgi:WXXGXW repeat (2 copies)
MMTATLSRFSKKCVLPVAIGIATLAGIATISGCRTSSDTTATADNSGPDPSDANMAPVTGSQQAAYQTQQPATTAAPARVLASRQQNESQQSAEEYAQNPAPAASQQDPSYSNQDNQGQYDQTYEDQVDAGQQALEADSPPPPLPTYQQPEAPGPNYIWTPGYWGYAPVGYYWVPGAWVAAPYTGALWTPAYWGFVGNRYRFHPGFWGPHIGFYGGVNYGFGYTGSGYHGGYWNGNNFYYNRAVNRINETRITNVYNRTVVVNNTYNRVSYNGGRGGIPVRPQPAEIAAMRGPRTPPMSTQLQNQREAATNRQQFYNQNQGRPAIVAAPHPFVADHGVQPVARPVPVNLSRPNPPNQQVQPNRFDQPRVQPTRPAQPIRTGEPQIRPVNPTQAQTRPAPQTRPVPAQPEVRPAPQQLQRQSEARSVPQPQPQYRPAPQPQPRAVPENQPRAVPENQPRPVQPQPQRPAERPAPQEHMAPQARSQPQPHAEARPQAPRSEEHPH